MEETQYAGPEDPESFEAEQSAAELPDQGEDQLDGAGHPEDEANESLPKKARAVVKKPPSKWVLFLTEHRAECSRENPDLGFADITKLLAEQYKNISEEETNRLDKIIQEQKERWEEFQRTGGAAVSFAEEASQGPELHFPLVGYPVSPCSFASALFLLTDWLASQARIRKIIKADPEVRNISKDALLTLTKASELFLAQLAVKSLAFASMRGVKSLQVDDAIQAIHTHSQFDFLIDDFPRRVKQKKTAVADRSAPAASTKSAETQASGSAAAGRRSIQAFLSSASSAPSRAAEANATDPAETAPDDEAEAVDEEQEEELAEQVV